jgi:hypothetical protein
MRADRTERLGEDGRDRFGWNGSAGGWREKLGRCMGGVARARRDTFRNPGRRPPSLGFPQPHQRPAAPRTRIVAPLLEPPSRADGDRPGADRNPHPRPPSRCRVEPGQCPGVRSAAHHRVLPGVVDAPHRGPHDRPDRPGRAAGAVCSRRPGDGCGRTDDLLVGDRRAIGRSRLSRVLSDRARQVLARQRNAVWRSGSGCRVAGGRDLHARSRLLPPHECGSPATRACLRPGGLLRRRILPDGKSCWLRSSLTTSSTAASSQPSGWWPSWCSEPARLHGWAGSGEGASDVKSRTHRWRTRSGSSFVRSRSIARSCRARVKAGLVEGWIEDEFGEELHSSDHVASRRSQADTREQLVDHHLLVHADRGSRPGDRGRRSFARGVLDHHRRQGRQPGTVPGLGRTGV